MKIVEGWMRWITRLGRQSRRRLMALTFFLVLLIGATDYITGYEISFSVFYLGAVCLATWFIGFRFALVVAVGSVACWFVGDVAAGARYTSRFVLGWNAAIALSFYVVMIRVLSSLRSLQEKLEAKVRERTAALTDEMTARERLEKELLSISEREQRRIGHDLHDSLCQHLTGTALAGHVLGEKLAARGMPEIVDANRVVALVEEGIALARSLARGLAPVELEEEGLMAAFRELARSTSERLRIQCRFDVSEPVLIGDADTATHLFRIAQEAISNAIRHGRAQNVRISLSHEAGSVALRVKDDGSGLPDILPPDRGMGLHIMQHRAAMIGARFSIKRESAGTLVTCVLPGAPLSEGAHE
jgi:signal transduction histidine kinase